MWALIPSKSPAQAKSRLAGRLSADECGRLSAAMLADLIEALSNSSAIDEICLLTDAPAWASAWGQRVFADEAGLGLNGNLERSIECIREISADAGILIIHGDVPAVTAAAIDQIATSAEADVTIFRAIRDGGTNALLLRPGVTLPLRFGADSAAKHVQAARAANLNCSVVDDPRLGRDIDTPEDLDWLANHPVGPETEALLATLNHSAGQLSGASVG